MIVKEDNIKKIINLEAVRLKKAANFARKNIDRHLTEMIRNQIGKPDGYFYVSTLACSVDLDHDNPN